MCLPHVGKWRAFDDPMVSTATVSTEVPNYAQQRADGLLVMRAGNGFTLDASGSCPNASPRCTFAFTARDRDHMAGEDGLLVLPGQATLCFRRRWGISRMVFLRLDVCTS